MFAKLKKKIEDEVGDLGQLTSPLANPFGAAADRRVGGSSHGSNTPNNLGSRQSSVNSLVDLHPIDEHASINPNPNMGMVLAGQRSSNSAAAIRQKQQDGLDTELKKVNAELTKKFETMKKSYEERIQNQEADFAWKYSSKDDELERVRLEKKKSEENSKNLESQYQNKLARVQDDLDQLEGLTNQEMAKVKHLLLITQADLQRVQSELVESESKVKEISEENRNLKAENDSILRNLDRDRLQRVRFDSDQADTKTHISGLQNTKQQLENEISTLKEDILTKNKKIDEFEKQMCNVNSEKQGEIDAFERRYSEIESSLKTQKANSSNLTQQVSEYKNTKVRLENDVKALQAEIMSKNVIVAHVKEEANQLTAERLEEIAKLQNSNIELEKEVRYLKDNLEDSKINEIHDLQKLYQIATKDVLDLKTENQELNNKLTIISDDLQSKQIIIKEHYAMKDEVLKIQKSKERLDTELKNLAEEKRTLTEQLDSEKLLKSKVQEKFDELKKRVIEMKDEALKQNFNRTELIAQIEELESFKVELKTQIDFLNNEIASKQEMINHNSSSDEQLDSRVDDLQKQIADLTTQLKQNASTESKLKIHVDELKTFNIQRDNQIAALMEDIATGEKYRAKLLEDSSQSEGKLTNTFLNRISELEVQLEKNSALGEKHNELQLQVNELKNSKLLLGNEVLKLKEDIRVRTEMCTELETNSDELRHKISELEEERSKRISELSDLVETRDSNVKLGMQILQLNEEINAKQVNLAELLESSLDSEKRTELLHHTLAELELKMTKSNEGTAEFKVKLEQVQNFKTQLESEIVDLKSRLEEKDHKLSLLQNQLINHSAREAELLQELKVVQTAKTDLEGQLTQLSFDQSSSSNNFSQFRQKVEELESQLRNSELHVLEHNDVLVQVSELQSTKDELEEEIKFLKEEVQVRDLKIVTLEKNTNNSTVIASSDPFTEIQDENEEMESFRERIRELESQLGDKNKALKLRQQQLQDLRKSLAKEIRNTPGDSISKSGSQTSLRELDTPVSHPETEPAVIQSSNSHSSENSNCSAEDVNFQYMKSVIFKYVTSSDPQMTHHLTKVVSTLLHLNDEEQRLLQKSTDRRLLSWLGTRDHVL